jgi:photosystem II stability/assembly factor-like uncharacterized protein
MSRYRLSTMWRVAVVLAVAITGCHHEVPEDIPSADSRKITIADRFYDVVAFDDKTTIVSGYAGKILRTEDGGYTWTLIPSGTDKALYAMRFVDRNKGWIVGQEGLILHTEDGGKSWSPQTSHANVYLFSVEFVNDQEGWAVGDKATFVHTMDGGKNWQLGKLGTSDQHLSADEQLLAQEPVLYAVRFVTPTTGWIIGEFGNIYKTTNAGKNWQPQQSTLIGQGITDSLDIPTFFGAAFLDENNGVATGLDTKIARTRDGGQKWIFDTVDMKEGTEDPLYQPFMFPDTTAWAVGAAAVVLHQRSTGEPWLRVPVGEDVNTWLRGVYFITKDDGWIVGGFGTILHTTDGGQTWLRALG